MDIILPAHYLFARGDPDSAARFSNRGFQIIVVGAALEFFAVLSVLLRMYIRIRLVRVVALDDVAMMMGLLCASAVTGLYIWAVIFGLGSPLQDISSRNLAGLLKALFIAKILYHPAILFIKASIIFFILRLTPFPGYRKILWITISVTAAYLLGAMAVTCFQCQYYLQLDKRQPFSGRCISQLITTILCYITSGVNISTDIMLVIFPIPLLWNAPIPKRTKNIIRFVLSLGVFVTTAAAIRLIYILLERPNSDISHKIDYIIWTIVELHVGILVVNIPAYAPMVKSYLEQQQQRKRSNPSLQKPDPKHKMLKLRVVQNTTVDVHIDMLRPGTKSSDGNPDWGKTEWDRVSNDPKDSSVYLGDIEGSRVNIYVGRGPSPTSDSMRDIITEVSPTQPSPVHFRGNELSDQWPLPPSEEAWPLPDPPRRKGSNFSMEESRMDFS